MWCHYQYAHELHNVLTSDKTTYILKHLINNLFGMGEVASLEKLIFKILAFTQEETLTTATNKLYITTSIPK